MGIEPTTFRGGEPLDALPLSYDRFRTVPQPAPRFG